MRTRVQFTASGLALIMLFAAAPTSWGAFIYSYAEQSVTGLTVTGVTGGTVTSTTTGASVVVNGSGISTTSPTDTLQAYLGAPPPAPQNSYVKYSTSGGGPQPGDFTRGDALLSGAGNLFTTGASASNVAESFFSPTTGYEAGHGSWSLTGTFQSNGPSVTVSYNWFNDIIDQVSGVGPAASSFGMTIAITDQHGHEVDASPLALRNTLTAPPNGPEFITSGSGSSVLSLGALTSGDLFTITITGSADAAAGVVPAPPAPPPPAAVPEPSSLALLSLAGFALAGWRRWRKRCA